MNYYYPIQFQQPMQVFVPQQVYWPMQLGNQNFQPIFVFIDNSFSRNVAPLNYGYQNNYGFQDAYRPQVRRQSYYSSESYDPWSAASDPIARSRMMPGYYNPFNPIPIPRREEDPWIKIQEESKARQRAREAQRKAEAAPPSQASQVHTAITAQPQQSIATKPEIPTIKKEYRANSEANFTKLKRFLTERYPDHLKSSTENKLTITLNFKSSDEEKLFLSRLNNEHPSLYHTLCAGSEQESLGGKETRLKLAEALSSAETRIGNSGTRGTSFMYKPEKVEIYEELHEHLRRHNPEIKQEFTNIDNHSAASYIVLPEGNELEEFKKDLKLKNWSLYHFLFNNESPDDTNGMSTLPNTIQHEKQIASRIKELTDKYYVAKSEEEKNKIALNIFMWTSTLNMFTIDAKGGKVVNGKLAGLLDEAGLPQDFTDWVTAPDRIDKHYWTLEKELENAASKQNNRALTRAHGNIRGVSIQDPFDRELILKHGWAGLKEQASKKDFYAEDTSAADGMRIILDRAAPVHTAAAQKSSS